MRSTVDEDCSFRAYQRLVRPMIASTVEQETTPTVKQKATEIRGKGSISRLRGLSCFIDVLPCAALRADSSQDLVLRNTSLTGALNIIKKKAGIISEYRQ